MPAILRVCAMNVSSVVTQCIRVCRNAVLDLRFGGLLIGKEATRYRHLGASNVENTDYAALSHIFTGRIRDSDVLADVGCGKGRVINWWLMNAYQNRMVGLELDEKVAEKVRVETLDLEKAVQQAIDPRIGGAINQLDKLGMRRREKMIDTRRLKLNFGAFTLSPFTETTTEIYFLNAMICKR